MKTLYVLIDSIEYIRSNCYQHQFADSLIKQFDVKYIELNALSHYNIQSNSTILSCLRLRTLFSNIDLIATKTTNCSVYVYDQDPWESFIVDSTYFNSYHIIHKKLNVKSFLNPSHWWVKKVQEQNLPSCFIQMWLLPQYCVNTIPWKNRKYDIIFAGSLHARRKKLFDDLKKHNINVQVFPSTNYHSYLSLLSQSKIMIHSENVNWHVQFQSKTYILEKPNALWMRDIDCAARGCFSMRQNDEEGILWGINKIPSIVTFENIDDIIVKINNILNLSTSNAENLIDQSITYLKSVNGWNITDLIVIDN